MNEINQRWRRDNVLARRLTMFGVALLPALWGGSYLASLPASQESFHTIWFGVVSATSLVAAMVVTIATTIGIGHVLTDEPPLSGDNR